MRARFCLLTLCLSANCAQLAYAATSTYLYDATLPLGGVHRGFGLSVAISDKVALVAAPTQSGDTFGTIFGYERDVGGAWSGETTFPYVHFAIDAGSYMPCNGLALDGDIAVVGMPDANGGKGVAQVMERGSSGWALVQTLSASSPSAFESFGCGVGVSGNTMVVSAPGHSGTGAAYVFMRGSSGWELQAELAPTGAAANDAVGLADAIDGDLVVLGAPYSNSDQGAAYVFRRTGTTWTQIEKLLASDGAPNDEFGASVSVSNDTVAVGAPERSGGEGGVYIYAGASFVPQSSPLWITGHGLGSAVALSGNRMIVGDIGSNSAYAYTRSGTRWYMRAAFVDTGATRLGNAVAISGSNAVIGAVAGDRAYVVHDDEIFGNGHE